MTSTIDVERGPVVETTVAAPTRERLLALDVFRGATVAGMLLVNDPGSWSAIYPPLKHAQWHGWTATDLVFPFFLFIVGVTTHLSLEARRARGDREASLLRQVLRRGLIIILLGLVLNWFPFYSTGAIEGNPDPTFGERFTHKLHYLRFAGVLQRIGLCYLVAGLLVLRTTVKQQVVTVAALLFGYWFLMTLVPVPGTGQLGGSLLDQPSRTLAAYFDRAILGENHLWRQSKTWDPEGPVSTLPAIATTILGMLAGRWIATKRPLVERIAALAACAALAMMVGLMWHWVFPINKNLWTSSYVLFTGGMAALAIATCMWIIDVQGVRWWTMPFAVFGVNPILAFVGSGLMARFMSSLIHVQFEGKSVPLQAAIYRTLFTPFFSPKNASLLFAISFVLVWFAILLVFYRRKWILKV